MPAASSSSNATSISAAASNEKASTFLDLRRQYFHESQNHRFGLGSSTSTASTFSTMATIYEYQSSSLAQSTTTKEPISASPGFGTFLTPLGLPTRSPLFSSPDHYLSKGKSNDTNDLRPKRLFRSTEGTSAASKTNGGSDTDTATTASITTSASSPTPSFRTSSSDGESSGYAERIEFVLDNTDVEIPDWISNSDSRGSELEEELDAIDTQATEFKTKELESGEYEYEGDDDEDDMCSCSTPVLTNTSRPHQLMRKQHSFVSVEEEGAVTTTTTTETKTTTTTTTQTTTSSSVSTSAITRTISEKNLEYLEQQGDIPNVGIQTKISNNDIATLSHHESNKTSSALATTTTSAVTAKEPQCYCKSCASKKRLIDRQRREIRHMKGMMKKLCLLLADTVRAQEENKINDDQSKRLALDPSRSNTITDGSDNEIIASTPSSGDVGTSDAENGDEGDSSSVATSTTLTSMTSYASTSSSSLSSTTSSKFLPRLHRPRIASLPVTSVGKDCPRIKNERIQVSGHWGTYSGPCLLGKQKARGKEHEDESKEEGSNQDEIEDESSDAGILLGCVVRMDDTSLYVGSLSRNDTGSFTFHPPGTLYDHDGKAVRRIR